MDINRRDFLKIFGGAIGGSVFGGMIGNFLADNYRKQIFETVGWMSLSAEGQKKLAEVAAFRKSLGLADLPVEVTVGLSNPEHWDKNKISFNNSLPAVNQSYGERIREIVDGLFGENGFRNIAGVKRDQEHPKGMSFDPNSRLCNVSDTIHETPIGDQFNNYVLHEACGHGTDPAVGAKYPPEILAEVEHGKWRALSQCLSIPDQFLNHPSDSMFPLLKKYVGGAIALFMTGKDRRLISDSSSIPVIQEEIARIAEKRGKNIRTLKYNKAVCKEVGEVVMEMCRKGKIKFSGELKKVYQETMEIVCSETYAEMVKYALMYPDKIMSNRDVIEGIAEVIRAIRNDGSSSDVRQVLSTPSPDVLYRNEQEKKALIALQSPEATTPGQPPPESPILAPAELSPEEIAKVKIEQEIFEKAENDFATFSTTGLWPQSLTVDASQYETFQEFALSYSRVVNRYPMLKNTFAQQYNESFDPDLHYWEIQEIESAMESGFVRNVLLSDRLSPEIMKEIASKRDILTKFTKSSAF